MQDFKNRLLSYISDNHPGSIREFERKCNLTNGQISSIKAQGPTVSVLKKIADACPDLDLNWLLRGEALKKPQVGTTPPVVNIENAQTVNIGNWDELANKLKDILK